jgi:hypothetical protein
VAVCATALLLAPRLVIMWLLIRYLPSILALALLGALGERIYKVRGAWRRRVWLSLNAVAWCAAGVVGFWWLSLSSDYLAGRGLG